MVEQIPFKLIAAIILAAAILFVVTRMFYNTPQFQRVDEGFYGGTASGTGYSDCLRDIPQAAHILNVLAGTSKGASESYRELELILRKMACLKKDIMAPSGQVDATRFQAFDTNHDRVSVAELAGLCMSKNIPMRDLDIIFETWKERGSHLISVCAVEQNMNESSVKEIDVLFKKVCEDMYDISRSKCIKSDFIKLNDGDVGAYEPENIKGAGMYSGRGSGWNGAI
jgi:hypothetical protein